MKITLTSHIDITGAPEPLVRKIRDTFTIENPRWIDNDKMSRWNGGTDHWLTFYENHPGGLTIPRGAMGSFSSSARKWVSGLRSSTSAGHCRGWTSPSPGSSRSISSRPPQDILSRDFGVLQAPTGSGKTVMALSIISERRQPTLIIVQAKELLDQWIERIEQFLGIPREEIGIIGNGKMKIGERITVGIINSIYPIAEEIQDHIGHLVIDECHRCPSRTFTEAVTSFDCKYMLGLSATPYRRDGLTKLIGWHLGRKIEVKQSELTENDIIQNVEVIIRETAFVTNYRCLRGI